MAAFQIYCDKENSNERSEKTDSLASAFPHDFKKEQRQKLLALTNLPVNNENAPDKVSIFSIYFSVKLFSILGNVLINSTYFYTEY